MKLIIQKKINTTRKTVCLCFEGGHDHPCSSVPLERRGTFHAVVCIYNVFRLKCCLLYEGNFPL